MGFGLSFFVLLQGGFPTVGFVNMNDLDCCQYMLTVDNSLIRVCIRKFCSSGAFGWEEQAGSVSSFHPGFFFTTSSRGLFFFLLFLFWACFTIPSLEANVLRAMTGPPGIAKGRLRGVGKGAFYVNSLIGIFSCLAASLLVGMR